jgi:hypothetical protein
MTDSADTAAEEGKVVVVDLGKKNAKHVKRLRKGRGKLMDQVQRVVSELNEDEIADAKDVVVVIVERRPKRRPRRMMW